MRKWHLTKTDILCLVFIAVAIAFVVWDFNLLNPVANIYKTVNNLFSH